MQLVSNPLVTAGVALVDAGVVAVTPMAAPPPGLPDVQTRAVQLMSGSDPLTEWGTVLQTAEADATDIYDHFSAARSRTCSRASPTTSATSKTRSKIRRTSRGS